MTVLDTAAAAGTIHQQRFAQNEVEGEAEASEKTQFFVNRDEFQAAQPAGRKIGSPVRHHGESDRQPAGSYLSPFRALRARVVSTK